jgi:glycosyltransferase involved in cell wall biosynthesis
MPLILGACRRILYRLLDAVVCPAKKSTDALREDCPSAKVINIPNIVIWPPVCERAEKLPRLDPGRRRFVTCGRLVFDKGFEDVIEAFASVSDKCSGWDLVVIGDGPAMAFLRAKVTCKGLRQRVIFTGHVDSMEDIYKSCEVFVYASPQEAFGMVIAEAQASGLPAICFDCLAGPSDIIRDEISGLLIRLGDVGAFSQAMIRLASNEELRASMAKEATKAKTTFGPEVLIRDWISAFRKSQ